jgi:hypothetical protein
MPRYQVYYARRPTFHPSGQLGTPLLTVSTLEQSHVFLGQIEAASLDEAFWQMQGENWSPHGEAKEMIQSLGLGHTSMSMGDVLCDENGICWECVEPGRGQPGGGQPWPGMNPPRVRPVTSASTGSSSKVCVACCPSTFPACVPDSMGQNDPMLITLAGLAF